MCECSHSRQHHNINDENGDTFCDICSCQNYRPVNFDLAVLDRLDAMMTEVDLDLWQWQADLDMLIFAGMEIPLVLYKDDEPIGAGFARLHHDDGALTMMVGQVTRPPKEFIQAWRLNRVKSKIAKCEDPKDRIPLVIYRGGTAAKIGFISYKFLVDGTLAMRGDVTEPVPEFALDLSSNGPADPEEHPFFRDDAMERRCIKCEHLVRQCICEYKEKYQYVR